MPKIFLRSIILIWVLCCCLMLVMRRIGQINAKPLLAYLSKVDYRNADIILADLNLGTLLNISNFQDNETADTLLWSPDGRYLAFRSSSASNWNYYLLDTSNWQTHQLISFERDTPMYWFGLHEILFLDFFNGLSQILDVETGTIRDSSPDDVCSPYCPFQLASNFQLNTSLVNDEVSVELIEVSADSNSYILPEPFPVWSAEAAYFIFRSDLQGQSDLYLAGAEGGIAQRLTNTPTSENMAVWSSDGRWISYVDYVGARLDVFVLDLDTLETKNISHWSTPDFNPAWQPLNIP